MAEIVTRHTFHLIDFFIENLSELAIITPDYEVPALYSRLLRYRPYILQF
jgi:hypothetical protein